MKTFTLLILAVSISTAQQTPAKIPTTRAEAIECLKTPKVKADWDAVLKGTHPKIGFTTPEAKQMCDAIMEGSEYKEALCKLAEPVAATEPADPGHPGRPGASVQDTAPPYNPPDFCTQVRRLQVQFQSLADSFAFQGALAGAGCVFGCQPCCVYGAGMALKVAYYETYVHWMADLSYINGCY